MDTFLFPSFSCSETFSESDALCATTSFRVGPYLGLVPSPTDTVEVGISYFCKIHSSFHLMCAFDELKRHRFLMFPFPLYKISVY